VIRLRRGVVTALGETRPGVQELTVALEGRQQPAVAYPDLTGEVVVGDTVLVNTTAVALGLGTGGVHFVVGVEGREAGDQPAGHVMKARYTPVQTAVQTVEETDRDVLEASVGLEGTPVVCVPLHSMIAPAAAAARRAGARRTVRRSPAASPASWVTFAARACSTAGSPAATPSAASSRP
jgi:Protein of unknown function (DUF3866)